MGVFKPRDGDGAPRAGVAIGDAVLDVVACHQAGLLDGAAAVAAESCARFALNGLMALDPRYWSARDIQKWEYQPLGPFLSKSFATTVSPWVVTLEALEPYRIPAYQRPAGDPSPLPHLLRPLDKERGGIDLTLQAWLQSRRMVEEGIKPMQLSRGNFRDMYWTPAQLIAHHTSNGCNLRPGDLLASGTLSGGSEDARGCLLERTWRGQKPILLPGGETRSFLRDGDEVSLRGYCERPGFARIGFGVCRGKIEPAI